MCFNDSSVYSPRIDPVLQKLDDIDDELELVALGRSTGLYTPTLDEIETDWD
jgi:hypothetical protein